MNLLLLAAGELDDRGRARLAGRRAEHLLRVLKVEAGRRLRAGVIGGGVGEARVLAAGEGEVEIEIAAASLAPPAELPAVDLIVALPRPAALHRILQCISAMGVRRLALTNAWRVEKSFFSSPALRPEAIRRHLVLGAEQGMTTRLPEVRIERLLVPFVDELAAQADARGRLIAHPDAGRSIEECFPERAADESVCRDPIEVAIGPEGGWLDREIETFGAAGFRPVSLGPWVLRVENAVTAVLAQLALLRRGYRPASAS